jgi:hypothetical protein
MTQEQYKMGLIAMGVRPDLVDTIVSQAWLNQVNPLLVGAFMMNESSGGTNAARAGTTNVMQVTGDTARRLGMPLGTPQMSIAAGAKLLGQLVGQYGETNLGAIAYEYAGPPRGREGATPQYMTNLIRALHAGGAYGDIPFDVQANYARAMDLQMMGSSASFAEMNLVLPLAVNALQGFATSVTGAAKAADEFRKSLQGPAGTANPWFYPQP